MRKTTLTIGVILLGLVPFVSAQMSGGSMSSDEMLQYTLNELKNRLQDVVQENTKLSNRNNALRKRMLSLRQDMRELENHKLNLMERNNDLRDFLKMDFRERALTVRKIKELTEEDSFSANVSEALMKAIEQNEARSEKLKSTMAKVQAGIQEIHRSRTEQKLSLNAGREEEKSALLLRIQKLGAGNRLLEKELPAARKKMTDGSERKIFLKEHQSSLKAQLQIFAADFEEASSQGEAVSAQTRTMTAGQDKTTEVLKEQVDSLTTQSRQMSGVMEDLLSARKKVADDVAAQELEIKTISGLLMNERQLLQEQKRILLARLEDRDGRQDAAPQIKEKLVALTEKIEPLKAERDELKTKISQQEQEGLDIKNKEAGLQRDIAQLNQDIKIEQQRGRQGKEEALRTRKANLVKLINDYQAKTQALKKQIMDRQKQENLSGQKIGAWQGRKEQLALALKAASEELAQAQDEEGNIRQAAQDLESRQGKGSEELKKSIEILEMRKAVLMSSLEAIRNKFNQDKDTIREFVQGDQKELAEYLGVLKAENMTLKDKALSLSRQNRDRP